MGHGSQTKKANFYYDFMTKIAIFMTFRTFYITNFWKLAVK